MDLLTFIIRWNFAYLQTMTILMGLASALDYWLGLGIFKVQVVEWKGDMWAFLRDFFNMRR